MDKNKLKKILTKANDLLKGKEVAVAKSFLEVEDKIDTTVKSIDDQLEQIIKDVTSPVNQSVTFKDTEVITIRGKDGKDGVDGINGTDGKDGVDGRDGRDGIDGTDGIDGKDGVDGINGKDGKDGTDGIDGVNGRDGINGSPDTPQEIVEKINSSESFIKKERIEGLTDIERIAKENAHKTYTGTSETRVREIIAETPASNGTGTTDHALLSNLDYASSGHTGFEPAKGADDNYVTDAEKVKLSNLSGTNTGDQDISGKADKSGSLTQFVGNTAFRVFYSDTNGDITELALGADGTFLKSNGAGVAPSFATPAGSGDVSKVGTPVANQVGYWTGDGTLAGDTGMTYNATTNVLTATGFVGALTGNADTVTTNANLTGHITSTGNATVLGSFTKAQLDTAVSDGNVMYIGDAPTAHTHALAAGATDVTSSAAELNILDGATLTTTELNYVDGVTSAIQTQLDGKVNDTGNETIAGVKTFSSDPIIPDEAYSDSWNGVLEPPTKNAIWDANLTNSDTLKVLESLGTSIKCFSVFGQAVPTTANSLTDAQAKYIAVYINRPGTITGVKWYQTTQGAYTADNNNYVALYSYSGGTMTQVAISANNGDIWKAAVGMGSAAFTTPYSATEGIYFIGFLANWSAVSTTPQIAGINGFQAINNGAYDLTNSARVVGVVSAQTTLPASQVMSGTSGSNTVPWFGLY